MEEIQFKAPRTSEKGFLIRESPSFPPLQLGRALLLILHTTSSEWISCTFGNIHQEGTNGFNNYM